jgi:hypothetical protein
MIAAMGNSNLEVINYLLSLGIDINTKNNQGDTALIKAASLTSEPKIIEALLTAGADPTIKNLDGTVAYEYAQLNPDLQGSETLTRLGQATVSGISPSPTLTTIEPSVPTSMIPIPEPSLLPIATPTPQITALPQPTVVSVPQSLIVSPPPGWISQPTEDPSEIGYYQLVNQQNIVIAEYLINLESLSSPLNPKGYLGYLQEFCSPIGESFSTPPGSFFQIPINKALHIKVLNHDQRKERNDPDSPSKDFWG